MSVVRSGEVRRTETPNAVMTTFASPTLGGAGHALWQVEMAPGTSGPEHAMDAEQIWRAVAGAATVRVAGGEDVPLAPGDTVVLPAGVVRRVVADPATGFTAVVTGAGGAHALVAGADPVVPAWIA
ncbi:cupin domain-containing protein [Pseudonocardia sp. N23]|uniref:cupin domain-containing protein n=1 Tax=Pseudonocardia sp. N23 TaxID=1987376 RepID=UPI000BFE298A|nr:cupin domain-containing protein [Pseudonocardia sp. N23]GAY12863.1 auxin-binding protein 1 precursor [Pseudonocardia sp. N23]